jgi:hypothetical protein
MYKFKFESLGPIQQWCTDDDDMVILHHLKWQFVTAACEQVHYFKW